MGFYSAFLVADKVRVQTKSWEDATQYVWESNVGSHEYTVAEDSGEDLKRGTRCVSVCVWGGGQELCVLAN